MLLRHSRRFVKPSQVEPSRSRGWSNPPFGQLPGGASCATIVVVNSSGDGFEQFEMRRSGTWALSVQVVTPTPPTPQCSIALWRGYVVAQFYVRSPERDEALGFSQTFRTWRFPWEERKPIENDPSALAALAALEEDLLAKRWERMRRARGAEWYELRFRRSAVAPERAESAAAPASKPWPRSRIRAIPTSPRQRAPAG